MRGKVIAVTHRGDVIGATSDYVMQVQLDREPVVLESNDLIGREADVLIRVDGEMARHVEEEILRKIEGLETERNHLLDRLRESQAGSDRFEAELDRCKEAQQNQAGTINSYQEEVRELQVQLDEVKRERDAQAALAQGHRNHVRQLLDQKEQLEAESEGEDYGMLKAALEDEENQVKTLRRQVNALKATVDNNGKTIRRLNDEVRGYGVMLERAHKREAEMMKDLQDRRTQVDHLTAVRNAALASRDVWKTRAIAMGYSQWGPEGPPLGMSQPGDFPIEEAPTGADLGVATTRELLDEIAARIEAGERG